MGLLLPVRKDMAHADRPHMLSTSLCQAKGTCPIIGPSSSPRVVGTVFITYHTFSILTKHNQIGLGILKCCCSCLSQNLCTCSPFYWETFFPGLNMSVSLIFRSLSSCHLQGEAFHDHLKWPSYLATVTSSCLLSLWH